MTIEYWSRPCLFDVAGAPAPTWLPGELVSVPTIVNGWAIKLPDGKFLSVQPDGSYQERDSVATPDEQGVSYEALHLDPNKNNILRVFPRVWYGIPYKGV